MWQNQANYKEQEKQINVVQVKKKQKKKNNYKAKAV